MKAISAIIATIMLLMITVSLVGVFYVFSSTIATTTIDSGSQQASQLTSQLAICMRIDNINSNKVDLRNCGKGIIENKSLIVTMDDVKLGASTLTINEGDSGTVNITGLWQISPGKHNLKISNGAAVALALVDVQSNKDGLVAGWNFDEGTSNKTNDNSGNGNDGILKNATSAACFVSGACPDWVNGKSGKGLNFDGIGDYVDVGNGANLNIQNAITVHAWVRTIGPNQYGSWQTIVGRTSWGNSYWFLVNNDRTVSVNLGGGVVNYNTARTSKTINNNEWTNLIFSYNKDGGASNFNIYINGNPEKTLTLTGSIDAGTTSLKIGISQEISGTTYAFNGIIDEVRIWNRAFAPDETIAMKQII